MLDNFRGYIFAVLGHFCFLLRLGVVGHRAFTIVLTIAIFITMGTIASVMLFLENSAQRRRSTLRFFVAIAKCQRLRRYFVMEFHEI